MEFEFLKPISDTITDFIETLPRQVIGKSIQLHLNNNFPDLENVKLAIIGVAESRGLGDDFSEVDLDLIRKEFYSLYPGNWNATIADLGDILQGDSIYDTYFALREISTALIKKGITIVVIGGGQDLTYPLYRSYDNLDQMVNLVSVDSKFDLEEVDTATNASSYLTNIIMDQPNNLFGYSNVGYQTYYNSQEQIDLIDKLFFDAYRLGEVSGQIQLTEPVFRDADIVSVDLTSMQSQYLSNFYTFAPNGFSPKEICALSRYAGISDRVSVFGIFNFDNTVIQATVVGQMMWYFFEGYSCRYNEYPFNTKVNCTKYYVPSEEDIVFYKSDISERWWMELPIESRSNNNIKKIALLSCTYQDYLKANEGEIPERWWKAQKKTLV